MDSDGVHPLFCVLFPRRCGINSNFSTRKGLLCGIVGASLWNSWIFCGIVGGILWNSWFFCGLVENALLTKFTDFPFRIEVLSLTLPCIWRCTASEGCGSA